jgi:hypothetical protein
MSHPIEVDVRVPKAGRTSDFVGDEKTPRPNAAESTNSSSDNLESQSTNYTDHVFSDPKIADYWRAVYEKAQYEGRHRFDPSYTWTPEEEKRLRRKVRGQWPQRIHDLFMTLT